MALYDIEGVLGSIQSFLLTNLNAQLSALDTEKNDGISLKQVNAQAYHLQWTEDRVELNDPFVLFAEVQEPLLESAGQGLAITYTVGIYIILSDPGTDPDIVKRLFRYRRALTDVFRANWASFAREIKLKLKATSPTPPFKDTQTAWVGRSVGVLITFTIAE